MSDAVHSGPADPRLVILANLSANAMFRLGHRRSLLRYARAAGFRPELYFTVGAQHQQRLLRQRVIGQVPMVAVAGGDGTVHSALQILAGTDVTLGILPLGRANNFATALGLPLDLPSAFRILAHGRSIAVDLGKADDEYFAEAAGAGLFAHLLAITRGHHRFVNVWRGLGLLFGVLFTGHTRHFALEIDGVRQQEDAVNVTVANTFAVGYNLPIAPDAQVTDRFLDVVIVGPLRRREMIPYYLALRAQAHTELPKVQILKARRVRISAGRARLMHIDDRPLRRRTMLIEIVPGVLRVRVDHAAAPAAAAEARRA
jgi:diacylglycerol kinase (ATP)